MNQQVPSDNDLESQIWTGQSRILGQLSDELLAAAGQLGVAAKPVRPFPLPYAQRASLASVGGVPEALRNRLDRKGARYTTEQAIHLAQELAAAIANAERDRRPDLLRAARQLTTGVHALILTPAWAAAARSHQPTKNLYQLKVTLARVQPEIWRRIQTPDCTLDRLHELIQTSMGWTNSHLHDFDIGGQRYGDPELMCEDFHQRNYRDSRITLLSMVLPEDHQRVSFRYVYDFGDSWEHEVVFEGCPQAVEGQRYPLCVEGMRACPPEDVGGTIGYREFLEAIEPNRSESLEDLDDLDQPGDREEHLEWAGGWFDPEEFDAATATKSMWKGIFDWRNARD